jgi:hypothetical protein
MRVGAVVIALAIVADAHAAVGQGTSLPSRVVPVVVVSRDLSLDSVGRVATRSPSWRIRTSKAWWPLLQTEFGDLGVRWQGPGAVKPLLLVQGAGAWAGSESENDGLTRPGDAGRIPGGNKAASSLSAIGR